MIRTVKKPAAANRSELQRILSKRGFASRSKAAEIIKAGKVTVNGKIIRDPNAYIPVSAKIVVDGAEVFDLPVDQKILIAFHKPKGVVTTASDEKDRKTVYDLLPEKYRRLKAIGRLDMATTGLLLFTNDNDLADRLLDPKNKIPRTYVATVKGSFTQQSAVLLKKGIKDGSDTLRAQEVEIRKSSGKESILIITLVEGKNREIRRMCEKIGHEVVKLKRISFGDIELGDLEVGGVRMI